MPSMSSAHLQVVGRVVVRGRVLRQDADGLAQVVERRRQRQLLRRRADADPVADEIEATARPTASPRSGRPIPAGSKTVSASGTETSTGASCNSACSPRISTHVTMPSRGRTITWSMAAASPASAAAACSSSSSGAIRLGQELRLHARVPTPPRSRRPVRWNTPAACTAERSTNPKPGSLRIAFGQPDPARLPRVRRRACADMNPLASPKRRCPASRQRSRSVPSGRSRAAQAGDRG